MPRRLSYWRICLTISALVIAILISTLIWRMDRIWSVKLFQHILRSPSKGTRCPAIDWSNHSFCIESDNGILTHGIAFNVSSTLLRDIGVPLVNFEELQRSNLNDFVFATAADSRYFHAAMDAIGNVQDHFPNHSIYFYDLSTKDFCRNLTSKFESLCNVHYRKFNFSRFPAHVRFLKNYAFKPVIVQEMLVEFPRVFWIDSSVRFKTGNLKLNFDEIFASGGILTFEGTYHSNFAVTHSGMYRYLPISASDASKTIQFGAHSIYIHRNELLYNRIIAWWVLCALENDCIAPILQLNCNFKGRATWAGCHRYDQAALNILLAHHFKYNVTKYGSRQSPLSLRRHKALQYQLSVCPDRSLVNSSAYFSKN